MGNRTSGVARQPRQSRRWETLDSSRTICPSVVLTKSVVMGNSLFVTSCDGTADGNNSESMKFAGTGVRWPGSRLSLGRFEGGASASGDNNSAVVHGTSQLSSI